MFFFKTYFDKIVQYDLVNTFFYRNVIEIPKLERIILNFGYQKSNFKYFISSLLALEFISSKKGKITKSTRLNVILKIKKGDPVGCKVVLEKNAMYSFYIKLVTSLFSKVKQLQASQLQQDFNGTKSISFQLKNPLLFTELENQFQFFKNLPKLDITLVTTSKSQKELFFLLKSTKFFL